ncbi:inositol monophosphatase family protein [Nocardioides dongxiaopingii]|uniref:inositol monophosphatase family protein n=1 Tax=Nocardioides dongxiaopingii TaxID=2576036 RepID=UPI0010C763D1|nr:inositol monophosphatase [Nocardioides dongxiaopingii]
MQTDAITTLLQDVAAEVITPRFRSLDADQISEKKPGDLVTVADHEAEVLITAALQEAYPDAVVLGEEAFAADPSLGDRYATAEHAFTVDPVDGTKNFVNGSPDHAVMAAELRDGVVVRSWIWQPQHEVAYVAELGAGASRNGEPLVVTPPTGPPSTWRGVTSRRAWVGQALEGRRPLELSWVCCGVDYPQLVSGAADYLLYSGTMPWDHAPGGLLLTEAGGALRTPSGEAYDPRTPHPGVLVAAASDDVHADVVARWSF